MPFALSNSSIENRQGVDPRLIEISDLAITLTVIDFGHGRFSGLRTEDIQFQLYVDNKSKLDGIKNLSKHQTGKALDFYAFVNGKASWQHEHLAMVACAFFQAASMLGYKIRWGGLWPSTSEGNRRHGIQYGWDMPHIELIEE